MRISGGRRFRALVAALLASGASTVAAAADNPAEVFELPAVEVIGTTPLPGLGSPLRDVPANVQVFGNRAIANQRPPTLTQFLDQNANSVNAASGQGNPFQQSLSFRGFAASPLLGTPQGISVFQDGVRINEAFGDVVNWDLIPPTAISSVQLIPGSVSAFGLNTLGGALAIYTKSGAQYPGGSVEISGGSFRRKDAVFEYGGKSDRIDYYATGHFEDDAGWAEHNPSRVKQFFGKIGYQDDRTDFDVSTTLADNTLQGTQTLPPSMLDDPRQAYTYPDINQNRLAFVAAKGSRFLSDAMLLGGNAYYRRLRSTNFSSNVNDDYGEPNPQTGVPENNEAVNDQSSIDQSSWGIGGQLTINGKVSGFSHQLVVGASGDFGRTRFTQEAQPANFTADRGTVAAGPFSTETDVDLSNDYVGVYATDTVVLSEQWTMTIGGRYNHARISIDDRTGEDEALNGTHTYSRFNPAIGINFNPGPLLTAYAGYNEGMRAPTPIELTCADPTAPCKLPNQFLADPPLKKVVAKTIEGGARGKLGAATTWSLALYRTELDDDIAFIASGSAATNTGYFQNVGRTRRQGIELNAATRLADWLFNFRYNHIDATFQSTFIASSPNNSSANADGAITVQPGDRIPGIPCDSAKLRVAYDPDGTISLGVTLVYASSQYALGDENNQDVHRRLPAYAVVHLDAMYQATATLQLFAQVANLFDRRYQSVALLGANVFTGPSGTFGPASGIPPVAEQFRAPGAPRGIWVGLRYALEPPRRD
ncbi:MAG TPA: TonB-dependent receptor [Casimicrobiaceae bacterium]